jgi:two-component system response regulator AtoC
MNDTKGKFELASEGTLFLDEIGEMPPEMQAKLLQVLQDGEYFRVGGTKAVKVNTRVVVATNRDLEGAIVDGSFRRDLYYRLNVVSVRVPSLRERPEDIEPLSTFFLERYARRYDSGLDVLPDEVLQVFLKYAWPGNVRELENLVRRMVVLGDPRAVLSEIDLNAVQAQTQAVPVQAATPISSPVISRVEMGPVDALQFLGVISEGELDTIGLKDIAHRAQVVAEREAIAHILRKCAWNKRKAAQRLQISYKALLYKIKECGIIDPRVEQSLPDDLPVDAAP